MFSKKSIDDVDENYELKADDVIVRYSILECKAQERFKMIEDRNARTINEETDKFISRVRENLK